MPHCYHVARGEQLFRRGTKLGREECMGALQGALTLWRPICQLHPLCIDVHLDRIVGSGDSMKGILESEVYKRSTSLHFLLSLSYFLVLAISSPGLTQAAAGAHDPGTNHEPASSSYDHLYGKRPGTARPGYA
uniref:Uncharacterized protein n=1 Tax=Sphaerodactylus townsendi TaxID=933632 RepID=A0ACB8F9I7_9SAUR